MFISKRFVTFLLATSIGLFGLATSSLFAAVCEPDTFTKVDNKVLDACARSALGYHAGTASCLVNNHKISQSCANCFADLTTCSYNECVGWSAPCGTMGSKGDSDECATCVQEKCGQKFKECSGLNELPPKK